MSQQDDQMRCELVLDHIEALVDDDLPAEFARGLERHLASCPTCAREADDARRTIAAIRALPELDPPHRLIEEARRSLGADDPGRPVVRVRRRRLLAAAAAIVVSVLGGIVVSRHHGGPDADAIRAAAEVEYALACIGEIGRRANRATATKVMSTTTVSSTIDGIARTFDLSARALPPVDRSSVSQPSEGSS